MHPSSQLAQLAREFRHLQGEHEREGADGSWRRRQGARLDELERDFETLLERWVPDTDERERWRNHLHHGGAEPKVRTTDTLLFKGRAAQGGELEIRSRVGGEGFMILDGAVVDHFPSERPIGSNVRFGDSVYEEECGAPEEALAALGALLSGERRNPPWSFALALYEEGIIDATFGVTERGRRILARR